MTQEEDGSLSMEVTSTSLGGSFCKWEDGSYSDGGGVVSKRNNVSSTFKGTSPQEQENTKRSRSKEVTSQAEVSNPKKGIQRNIFVRYIEELPNSKGDKKRKVRCKLCKEILGRKHFNKHIRGRHLGNFKSRYVSAKGTIAKYFEEFPNSTGGAKRKVKCRLCDATPIRHHFMRHLRNIHPKEASVLDSSKASMSQADSRTKPLETLPPTQPTSSQSQLTIDIFMETLPSLTGPGPNSKKKGKVRCKLCQVEMLQNNFARHIRDIHEKPFTKCDYCNKDIHSSNIINHKTACKIKDLRNIDFDETY